MRAIKSRSRNRQWKPKESFTQWSPWARKTAYTGHSLRDAEIPPTSHSPFSTPESQIVLVHASDESRVPSPSSSIHSHQALQSLLSSPSNRTSLHLISANSSNSHRTSDPSTTMPKSQDPSCNGPHDLCDDFVESTNTISDGPLDQRHGCTHPASPDGLPSDGRNLSQLEGASECSNSVSQAEIIDDLIRDIDIIVERGNYQRTYRYKMLIDSGNPHANLISRRVVDNLRLPRARSKPSFARRVLSKLAPWTNAGMVAKVQARGQIRNIDGTLIDGQDGTVTISWFGKNRDDTSDSILWFQPRRYETTHIVVDANYCAADIILSWKEVESLKLRQRFTGAIYRPPTPKSDPDDEKYRDYEKRRAENAAARKAVRAQKPGQSQSSSADSAKQTGK